MESLERDIQRALLNLLNEYSNQRQPPIPGQEAPPPTPTQAPTPAQTEDQAMIDLLRNVMEDYNDNIRNFLRITAELVSSRPRPRQNPFRQRGPVVQEPQAPPLPQTPIYTYYYYPMDTARLRSPVQTQTPFQDVVVRPTPQQIVNATDMITFQSNQVWTNTTCPITLEPFQDGEMVCQILHCRHIFREPAIRSWFRGNVRCPVCRYDIRGYVRPIEPPTMEQPQENNHNHDMMEDFSRSISAILQNAMQDTSGNLFDLAVEAEYTYGQSP